MPSKKPKRISSKPSSRISTPGLDPRVKGIPGNFEKIQVVTNKIPRRQFTGRMLVRFDPDMPLPEALAGGVIFKRLNIALVDPAQLQALPESAVLAIEPERYLYATSGTSLKNTSSATWGIQAVNVRSSKFTGKDVRMAILDTGFDFTHPDFEGRLIHRKSFAGKQARDREGHGTFCTGIAGGGRKGKAGARYGVASGARLYIGKILDNMGEGSDGQALEGIEWALENNCRVISMSFGAAVGAGEGWSKIFEDVAKTAMDNQCLLIAATGNESDREVGIVSPVNHPANCPSVLGVAALTESLGVANYSCGAGRVDIAAPGDNILSSCMGGGHDTESGTSMATPFVAGVAALLWEEFPDASAREIWDRLLRQARPVKGPATDTGAGLVYAR